MTAVALPHDATLVADTELVLTANQNYAQVGVWSDGTADVYFTANGHEATVGGDGCWRIPAGAPAARTVQCFANSTAVIRLISSGTPAINAWGVDAGSLELGGSSGGGSGVASSVAINDGTTTSRKATVTSANAVKVDGSGVTQPVSAASLPLPTGAATSANQATANTSLATIASNTPAAGQAAMAASSPVVIASDQSAVATSANAAARTSTTMQSGATANGNGTSLNVAGYAAALLNVVSSPSMSGGTTVNFEASVDDTTWVAIAAHTIGTNGSLGLTTTSDGDFRIATAGYKSIRARISGYSAGTVTVKGYAVAVASQPTAVALASGSNTIGTVTANAGTNLNTSALALDATLTGGTQQAKVTDGTNVANVLKSDGTAAGQNAQLVAGTHLAVSFTTSTVQAVASTDAANYAYVSVQITSQGGSSTVTFQCSDDNTNWQSLSLIASAGGAGTTTATTTNMWHGALAGRYFRLNVTGIASGTTAGTVEFFVHPRSALAPTVSQTGTWTVQPGNTANTTPWLVTSAAASGGWSFSNIIANTAGTAVKSGAGTLHSVSVNTAGASANVLTLYDGTNTSGTKIGTFDTTSLRNIPFDLAFGTGLFVVLATGTAADLTLTYK